MRLLVVFCIVLITCSSCVTTPAPPPPAPTATSWFDDKDLVDFEYVKPGKHFWWGMDSIVESYQADDFRVSWYNRGSEYNRFALRFRATPKNVQKYTAIHNEFVARGLSPSSQPPRVLTYKVSPEAKREVKLELDNAFKNIVAELAAQLPELGGLTENCISENGIRYEYTTPTHAYRISLRMLDMAHHMDHMSVASSRGADMYADFRGHGYFLELHVSIRESDNWQELEAEGVRVAEIVKEKLQAVAKNYDHAFVARGRRWPSP